MAELADALGSGPSEGNLVGVQVPPTVPKGRNICYGPFSVELWKKTSSYEILYRWIGSVPV